MSTLVRDPWADARLAATQEVLDPDVAAVCRRLWIRRALGLVLSFAVFLVAFYVLEFVVDPDQDELWSIDLVSLRTSFGLMGLGLVLVVVGAIRTTGAARPFVGPDAFLSRTDRAWLRKQVAEGRTVADGRQPVVADAARRMVVEGRYIPTYLGFVVMYIGTLVSGPSVSLLITFGSFTVFMIGRIARAAVWSSRARRWLAANA